MDDVFVPGGDFASFFVCVTLFIRHNMRVQFFRQMNYSFARAIYYIVPLIARVDCGAGTHGKSKNQNDLHTGRTDTEFM